MSKANPYQELMNVLTNIRKGREIRVYFLLLSLLAILIVGFLGAAAGASAQIQSFRDIQIFGLVTIQPSPFVMAVIAMFLAVVVLADLFGLVSSVSKYDENAL